MQRISSTGTLVTMVTIIMQCSSHICCTHYIALVCTIWEHPLTLQSDSYLICTAFPWRYLSSVPVEGAVGGVREGRREKRGREGGQGGRREGGEREGEGREGGEREQLYTHYTKMHNLFVCQTPDDVHSAKCLPLIPNYLHVHSDSNLGWHTKNSKHRTLVNNSVPLDFLDQPTPITVNLPPFRPADSHNFIPFL